MALRIPLHGEHGVTRAVRAERSWGGLDRPPRARALLPVPADVSNHAHTRTKSECQGGRTGRGSGERSLPESGGADPDGEPNDHGGQSDDDNVVDAVVAGRSGCSQGGPPELRESAVTEPGRVSTHRRIGVTTSPPIGRRHRKALTRRSYRIAAVPP